MKRDRILDDIARVAGGGVSILSGMTAQLRGDMKSRMDDLASRMDLVTRDEFEKLEAMLVQSRMQQDILLKRLKKLEQAQQTKKPARNKNEPEPKTVKKAPVKKPAKKKLNKPD